MPPDTAADRSTLTRYLTARRKLRVERPVSWAHHRSGWTDVVATLTDRLHCADGVRVLTSVEETMVAGEVVNEPWVGFLHEVPHHGRRFPDLERLLRIDTWKASARHCLGLWTLTRYQQRYLADRVACPVNVVCYPTAAPALPFDFGAYLAGSPRSVVHVGEYLRDYEAFARFRCPGQRKLLVGDRQEALEALGDLSSDVEILDYVDNNAYDRLLQRSVVFLQLIDAPANTTIIECIARNTPVLVNKVGAVPEYLGDSYPLYYDDLDDAARKLNDEDLLAETTLYLQRLGTKRELTHEAFVTSLQNTAVYRSLPVPRSQQTDFVTYDATVLVCSYRRTGDLAEVLGRLRKQAFGGTFEVILWNNNPAEREAVDRIAREHEADLTIKVIHSSENYFCIVRLAVASLMRSELLVICDDDVLPNENYLARLVERSAELGPRAAVCARGNVLLPHRLDEEHPESLWAGGENLLFFDERAPDRLVHYMHADVCAIPKALLAEAVRYDLPRPDFALVDDYWLSYVLAHFLDARLWKIQCDDVFTYTQASDDHRVALFHNQRVREELVNMYVHHMRNGWPWPVSR